jgi:hypothetical protein
MVHTLQTLVTWAREHTGSDFYKTQWGEKKTFEELPTVSRADFLRVPLSQRRYKNGRALAKIIHTPEGPFFSEWSFEDIGREPWGIPSKRPMVYLEDSHEALEKSMWCYENNMVPLIGERNPNVAVFAAGKYAIDSLITDAVSLPKLLPYLKSRAEKLASLTILGDSFDSPALMSFSELAHTVRLVLRLPETGMIAEAPLTERPAFRAAPGVFTESENDALIVTKLAPLITPIIRYRTDIPSTSII